MIINHNMNAMNAHRNMGAVNTSQGKAMEKLSSGVRINRAGDDAAGLAISEKMRSQIRGLNQASRNAQDGISMIQTAEGTLSETQAIGQRMRELAVQSSNGTYTDEDRELINQEFSQLKKEIDRIASDTEFNGKKLLDGTLEGKYIHTTGVEQPNTGVGIGMNLANQFHGLNEEILPILGKGLLQVHIEVDNDKNATIFYKDVTDPKDEYVMDSIKIKIPDGDNQIVSFQLYDKEFKMNFTFIDANSTTKFTIKNEARLTGDGMQIQVGANMNQIIGFNIGNMRSRELGLARWDLKTQEKSERAIEGIDKAIFNKILSNLAKNLSPAGDFIIA